MARELHVLDGLDLADGVVFDILDTPTFTPAPLRLDWVGGVDADGSIPLDAGHSDNCTLTIPLRVIQQTTADLAWTKVGLLLAKLEATRATRDGLTHLWTPKDSTSTWDLTVMSAEITEMPMASRGDAIGYLLRSPRFTVVLTCKPYLYRHSEVINFTAVQSYTNYITNPNFETNTTSWGTATSVRNATGGTLSRQTTQFHSGVASMRIVSTAVANQGADYITLPVVSGVSVTVAMWLRGNAGGESVKIVLGDATVGSATSSTLVLTTSWQLLSVTLAPGATGTTGVAIVQTAASVKTWFVDDVIAVYAATAPTYFDGGTDVTRNTWTGVANASTSTQDAPVLSMTLANVPGHVDAEATITVTDTDAQPRRHVEGGLGLNSAAPLVVDSASMTVTGFAGVVVSTTGFSGGGLIRGTLAAQPQAICGTGNLTHVGAHRLKARVLVGTQGVTTYLRVAYRTADGPYSYTPWVIPHATEDYCEVDFGVVTIGTVQAGTQRWDGRIEGYCLTIGTIVDVDYLAVLPVERWWKARGSYQYQSGLLVARDEFTGRTATNAITVANAPLPVGAAWVTSASLSATDFAAADAPGTMETVVRSTTGDAGGTLAGRRAILGSTSYGDIEVGVALLQTGGIAESGVIARYVDANNFMAATLRSDHTFLRVVVAGAVIFHSWVSAPGTPYPANLWYSVRLVVFTSGRAVATILDSSGAELSSGVIFNSALAVGGALATGKPGIVDMNSSILADTRYYKDFYAATPPAEPVAINSGRSIEFRHDSCERQSSDGVTYGPPKQFTGGRAYVPCAGSANRVTRLWVKARRNDVDATTDLNVTDAVLLDAVLRPRYRMPVLP